MISHGSYALNADGTPTLIQLQASYPDTMAIAIYNESAYAINVFIDGNTNLGTSAYTADCTLLNDSFHGNITVHLDAFLNAGVISQAPSMHVIVYTYSSSDNLTTLLKNGLPSGYPLTLNRLQSIGNTVNTNMSTVQDKIVNDGSAGGTSIVESTPFGNTASSVQLTNNGSLTLGDTINQNGILQINGTLTTSGVLNAQNNLTVGGVAKFTAGKLGKTIDGDIIDAGGNSTFIKGTTNVVIQAPNGTTDATVSNTGLVVNNGTITLNNQRITAIKGFNGSSTTTVTHGMGSTPNQVLVTPNTNTACWVSSVTSTTFTINTATATGWFCVAFIF